MSTLTHVISPVTYPVIRSAIVTINSKYAIEMSIHMTANVLNGPSLPRCIVLTMGPKLNKLVVEKARAEKVSADTLCCSIRR